MIENSGVNKFRADQLVSQKQQLTQKKDVQVQKSKEKPISQSIFPGAEKTQQPEKTQQSQPVEPNAMLEELTKLIEMIIKLLVGLLTGQMPEDLLGQEANTEQKAEGKQAEKTEDKPVEKTRKKQVEKTEDKPVEKTRKKQVEKTEDKPVEKTRKKQVEKTEDKPVEKIGKKQVEKTEDKPVEKIGKKQVKKAENKPVEKSKKKPVEKTENKQAQKPQVNTSSGERIAIIDNFYTKTEDLDGDNKKDISHGELIESIIKAEDPDAQIIRLNVPLQNGGVSLNQIQQKINAAKNNKSVGAVNLSLSVDYGINQAGQSIGKGVNNWNLKNFDEQIKNKLPGTTKNLVNTIESMNQKVFIAGGNQGNSSFNVFNLAENAINVGATEPNGVKAGYSAKNSLLDTYAQGSFNLTAKNGGFDINGDGKTDIAQNKLTSKKNRISFRGTSFATPLALIRSLMKGK